MWWAGQKIGCCGLELFSLLLVMHNLQRQLKQPRRPRLQHSPEVPRIQITRWHGEGRMIRHIEYSARNCSVFFSTSAND